MGAKTPIQIELKAAEREELEIWARSQAITHRMVSRARIILAVVDGQTIAGAARVAGCGRRIARKWAQRFRLKRLAGLADEPRPGRPPVFPPEIATHLAKLACELLDEAGRSLSLWTCAELARTLQRDGVG